MQILYVKVPNSSFSTSLSVSTLSTLHVPLSLSCVHLYFWRAQWGRILSEGESLFFLTIVSLDFPISWLSRQKFVIAKVIKIFKKEPEKCHAPTSCREHLIFCAFLELLRAAWKSHEAAEKNKEKSWSYLTALASQQSSLVLFCQENKNSNVYNFILELDKNPPISS